MMIKRAARILVAIGVTLFTFDSWAANSDGASWEALLASKYAALRGCGAPDSLKPREIERIPFQSVEKVWYEPSLDVSDGCSVTMYSSKEHNEYYLSVAGGFANHHRAAYGPLRIGEDF